MVGILPSEVEEGSLITHTVIVLRKISALLITRDDKSQEETCKVIPTHGHIHTHRERRHRRTGGRERKPPEAKLLTQGLDGNKRLRQHTEPACEGLGRGQEFLIWGIHGKDKEEGNLSGRFRAEMGP